MLKLKVRPVANVLVSDFEALNSGVRRFVGRRFDPSVGFVPLDEDAEVPFRAEYVQAVKAGELEPCDAETAKLCGVQLKSEAK